MLNIRPKAVPKEIPQSMTPIERYHGQLCREFQVINRMVPQSPDERDDVNCGFDNMKASYRWLVKPSTTPLA